MTPQRLKHFTNVPTVCKKRLIEHKRLAHELTVKFAKEMIELAKTKNQEQMKEVIRVDQIGKEKEDKPVEFTHRLYGINGWEQTSDSLEDFEKVVYLGKCNADGDMFAAYTADNFIVIYKGHLNSGKY